MYKENPYLCGEKCDRGLVVLANISINQIVENYAIM